MSAGPINTNAKARKLITAEIVQEALLKDKGPSAKLQTFEIIDFCRKGDSYSCFVTSVKVTFLHEGEEKCVTYVAKLNHCHGIEAYEICSTFAFEKEGNFYLKLVPDLNAVMKTLQLEPLKFPSCYFASFEHGRQIILLRDKREDSFKMADRFVGLDEDHVIIVLKELARLHAASVILEDNVGEEKCMEKYDFLLDFFTGDKDGKMKLLLKYMFAGYINNAAKIADRTAGCENASALLKELAPAIYETLEAQVAECKPKFRVINHGDCRNNNLLFKYGGEKVADVCLVDLQINRQASLALDLNYFFFTSLNGDTRKKGLESYLTVYYNTFKEVFDAAKKPMKFRREELYAEYRNKNLFGLLMAIMVLPLVVMGSAELADFGDVNVGNVERNMSEQQQEVMGMIETNPVLRTRILNLFDEMVVQGAINIK